ncbi:unnamed protein product [Pleuronectes platessa]|uniref:Uncharacterized protein n=1 Tax=Pleuronectes platessa TaxID=8262 RepID=A0A9N7UHP2_PLEPL|nr:unnamed protein product [Pleuronectes platessa]
MAGRGAVALCPRSGSGSRFEPGSTTDPLHAAQPASEQLKPQRRRRRCFLLTRTRSRRSPEEPPRDSGRPPPVNNNNNNGPFILHCHIGKEIKHICSNCRGAEPLDGQFTELEGGGGRRKRRKRRRAALRSAATGSFTLTEPEQWSSYLVYLQQSRSGASHFGDKCLKRM